MSLQPLDAALEVLGAFEELEIPYHLGGSYASSIHGVPRQTHDIDVVADIRPRHVSFLTLRLQDRFYVDPEMIRSALRGRRSFNLLHLASGLKIDIFPLGDSAFDREELKRHQPHRLIEGSTREVFVKSAEDILLRKLEWYRLGNQVSDRQWRDILGLVKTQGEALDTGYLRRWAPELGVADLLEAALERPEAS